MPGKTYQDNQGNSFGTYGAAAASNLGFDQTTYNNFKAANPTLEPNAQDAAMMKAAGNPIGRSSLGTPQLASTITSGSLQPPTQPFQTTQPAPATQTEGMLGYLAAQGAQQAATYQQQATAAQEQQNALTSQISSLLESPGKAQLTDQLYQSKGVDQAQSDLNDINSQIIAEQHALDRQLQALDANPNGLFGGALEQEKQKVRDASLARQADLSVIQLARQGKYDSAKTIADRAVSALTEAQANKLDALKFMYDANKDILDKNEQRAFETQQKDREFQLNLQRDTLMKQFDDTLQRSRLEYEQNLKQQDPGYQLDLQYKQAQIAKIRSELDSGNVNVTNPAAQPYAGVLNTILASGKFTKDQKASLIAGINSGEDPFTVIKNQAKNIIGQTEATTVTKYETAQSAMRDLQTQLRQFYASGGKTNIFSGNYEKVINNLGEVKDPQLVDLATQIQASLQVYRNAVSGTAYSEQEGKDIASIFPGINKSQGLNEAIIKGRMKAFDSTIDGTYRTALGSAYDQLKAANQQGVKGAQPDKNFVESTLSNIGASYQDVLNKVPAGKKAVIDNKTGQVGYIDPAEFDPALYTSL